MTRKRIVIKQVETKTRNKRKINIRAGDVSRRGHSPGRGLMRCHGCGNPITSTYYTYADGAVYCAACYNQGKFCDICSHPAGPGNKKYADGRFACSECRKNAVSDFNYAAQIMDGCVKGLTGILGLEFGRPVNLRLATPGQLAAMSRKLLKASNKSERHLGMFRQMGDKYEINIEKDLPKVMYISITSHELVHVWQADNAPPDQELLVKEGFAEYGAYLMQGFHGLDDIKARMDARDDIYGRGLKMVKQAAARLGDRRLVELMRSARSTWQLR